VLLLPAWGNWRRDVLLMLGFAAAASRQLDRGEEVLRRVPALLVVEVGEPRDAV
jgi:hypothetical protein